LLAVELDEELLDPLPFDEEESLLVDVVESLFDESVLVPFVEDSLDEDSLELEPELRFELPRLSVL
jgi:hypothetical protein